MKEIIKNDVLDADSEDISPKRYMSCIRMISL